MDAAGVGRRCERRLRHSSMIAGCGAVVCLCFVRTCAIVARPQSSYVCAMRNVCGVNAKGLQWLNSVVS